MWCRLEEHRSIPIKASVYQTIIQFIVVFILQTFLKTNTHQTEIPSNRSVQSVINGSLKRITSSISPCTLSRPSRVSCVRAALSGGVHSNGTWKRVVKNHLVVYTSYDYNHLEVHVCSSYNLLQPSRRIF